MLPYVKQAVALVPAGARVSATNTIGGQLVERQDIYQFPLGIDQSDYIVLLMAQPGTADWQNTHVAAEALQHDARFTLILQKNNLFVYKRT